MRQTWLKKRSLIPLFLLLLSSLSLTACSTGPTATQEPAVATSLVTDTIGRQVAVPDEINSIGTLFAVAGHITTMLGEGEKITAISNGLRRDKLLLEICPSIGESVIPKVSGSINVEEVLNADPDLIFIDNEIATFEKETSKFDKLHIPYFVVDFNTIDEQLYLVQQMGIALHQEEEAQGYIDFYKDCIERVETVVATIPMDQRVRIYHSVNEATRTDAPGTLPADWLKLVGAINVSLEDPLEFTDNKYFASLEQIMMWNPDVILVNEEGVDDYIRTKDQWQTLDAVINDRVYRMPLGISRWGHPTSIETPLAILWTAKTLYPDYFADIDLKVETRYFYKEFFEYDISEEFLDLILASKNSRYEK
ncbi:ABC transporter substrate-binding protein [Gottschalkiaceae bacterium SANA]|nr:ABC transporter substrate-binding protein [Gottschalkiaceae bacterium SANA]